MPDYATPVSPFAPNPDAESPDGLWRTWYELRILKLEALFPGDWERAQQHSAPYWGEPCTEECGGFGIGIWYALDFVGDLAAFRCTNCQRVWKISVTAEGKRSERVLDPGLPILSKAYHSWQLRCSYGYLVAEYCGDYFSRKAVECAHYVVPPKGPVWATASFWWQSRWNRERTKTVLLTAQIPRASYTRFVAPVVDPGRVRPLRPA